MWFGGENSANIRAPWTGEYGDNRIKPGRELCAQIKGYAEVLISELAGAVTTVMTV